MFFSFANKEYILIKFNCRLPASFVVVYATLSWPTPGILGCLDSSVYKQLHTFCCKNVKTSAPSSITAWQNGKKPIRKQDNDKNRCPLIYLRLGIRNHSTSLECYANEECLEDR